MRVRTLTSLAGFDPEGPFAGLVLPPTFRKRQAETRFVQRWRLTLEQYAAMMAGRPVPSKRKQRGSIIMSSMGVAQLGDRVVLNDGGDADFCVITCTALAGFRFTNGGSLLYIDDADPTGEWWSAGFTPSIGDSYEVRATNTLGDGWDTAAAVDDTWITMTAQREWSVTTSINEVTSANAVFEVGPDGVEVADDSALLTATAEATV